MRLLQPMATVDRDIGYNNRALCSNVDPVSLEGVARPPLLATANQDLKMVTREFLLLKEALGEHIKTAYHTSLGMPGGDWRFQKYAGMPTKGLCTIH